MSALSHMKRRAVRGWARIASPIAPRDLQSALGRLTNDVKILLVHSSLTACGHFTGGPGDVLRAIKDVCGTLVMPTFSYGYSEPAGSPGPVFDASTIPSQTGLLTEIYRAQPGVIRSRHATHSLAASGALAGEICAGHELQESPCGAGSPFDRMVQRSASALLLGVSFHSYTFFHTAEDASGSLFAYEAGTRDRLRVVGEDGRIRECWSKRQSRAPRRFAEAGDLLERAGLVRRMPLGRGALLFVPDCALAHEFLVERLKRIPDFLYQSCSSALE